MLGGTEVVADPDVGFIAAGPERGQGPEAIVRGFLLAAQSGPTMPTMFAAARQYLTLDAAHAWRPNAQVWVMDETAALTVTETEDPNRVTVHATGQAVATVSDQGIYEEFRFPVPHTLDFDLVYNGEDWRISGLDDGIVMPAQVFTATFRYTKLYHPSLDYRTWVPDVRWFPQTTWRTSAVQALLAGPPSFLVDVVQPAVPENAAVQLEEISEVEHGGMVVRLRGWLRDADAFNRALFQAQLALLLTDGSGTQPVDLADNQGLIPVPSFSLPQMPQTEGPAVAIADDALYWVFGRDLVLVNPQVELADLNITAIATAPGGHDGVVVREGYHTLWWIEPSGASGLEVGESLADDELTDGDLLSGAGLAGGEPGSPLGAATPLGPAVPDGATDGDSELLPEIPPGRVVLLTGESLIAPSIDEEGLVWTGELQGPIEVVDYLGNVSEVTANWLGDILIQHLNVAPGGRRVALVTWDEDAGTRILVAGVIRNAEGIPIGLAQPIEVGASIRDVGAVSWQSDAVLAVIGWLAGVHGVYQVGVGGLDAPGGLPRFIPGISEPRWLTASVGSGNMLAIDGESALHLREATSLWPIVGREVTFVAYPG